MGLGVEQDFCCLFRSRLLEMVLVFFLQKSKLKKKSKKERKKKQAEVDKTKIIQF